MLTGTGTRVKRKENEKMQDMEKLVETIMNHPSKEVRLAAVKDFNYALLSEDDKKKIRTIYLQDPDSEIRFAVLEKIRSGIADMYAGTEPKSRSGEKQDVCFTRHGARKGTEPKFQPAARGVFMIVETKKDLDEDTLFQIHMHAQMALKAWSEEYMRAQTWWENLPKTPARQKENFTAYMEDLSYAEETVRDWIDKCDAYEGLAYIFPIEQMFNLRTNRIQGPRKHIPVVAFNPFSGIHTLDELDEKECVTFRMYYAYYEQPEAE